MPNKKRLIIAMLIVFSFVISTFSITMAKNRCQNNLEKLVEQYQQVWNGGSLAILDKIIAPTFVNHSPGMPNPKPGPEGLKPIVLGMRAGFPDLKYEVLDVVYGKDKIAIRSRITGTHLGNFFGIPATGKKIDIKQMQIEQIKKGQIIAHWRLTDDMSMMKQLGLIPQK